MMGTAKYLSPEQVRGKRLDGRADLYSLGLVLYECLAGRVPFIGESDADTALARLQRDPTDLNRLRPTLPVGLVDLIHQTLARNPAHRPGTGQELRAALLAVDTTPPPIDPTPAVPSPRSARRADPGPPKVSGTSAPEADRNINASTPPNAGRPAIPGEPEISRGATDITPLVATRAARPSDLTPPTPRSTRQRSSAAAGRPRGRHTPLIVIGLLIAIAAVIAAAVWAGIGTESSQNLPTPPIENTDELNTSSEGASPEGEASGDEASEGAAGEVLGDPALTLPPPVGNAEIVAVRAWDPDGDASGENDELASLALPGADPPGGWPTLCYSSQYLGAKRGVGLIASLSQASSGTLSVESFTAPYWIEVFASDAPTPPTTLEGWGQSLTGTVYREQSGTVSSAVPAGTQHALVWLREVGRDPACSSTNPYRGRLGNLTFRP
jgi:serine/threonine-protein kinase